MLGKKLMVLAMSALAATSMFGAPGLTNSSAPRRRAKQTADDYARLSAAEAKRARKNAKRLKDTGQ